MRDSDIDALSADGGQERLRSFTPAQDYLPYVVTLMRTIYDEDQGRITVHCNAFGPANAKELAIEEVRVKYPNAFVLRAVRECPECRHDQHANRCIAAHCACPRVAEEVVGVI